MREPMCKECQNFCQHYGLDDKGLYSLYCGHCTLPRVKEKRPDAKACKLYVRDTSNTERFVRKEYLSKRVLEYLPSLDLLPEIKEQMRPSSE